MTDALICRAPAKLNLFLHVIGRRPDGYHLLQSVFRLLDWGDELRITPRSDGQIRRLGGLPQVPHEADLVVRAARLLQAKTGCRQGADIALDKHLPAGGGLGGGSSDAATVLLALNRLWQTGLKRAELQELGLALGADVPFFIHGRDAFVEGVGERFQSIALPPAHYVVLWPGVEIPTAEIFSSNLLTRDTPPVKMAFFADRNAINATHNDLQEVAVSKYPQVGEAIDWLSRFSSAQPRMTGSGSCVFAEFADCESAERAVGRCPSQWRAWSVASLSQHPHLTWVED